MRTHSNASAVGGSSQRRRRKGKSRTPWTWAIPAVVLLVAFNYIAVAAGAWYSLTNWSGSSASAKFVGLGNFRLILHDAAARTSLLNSVKLSVCFVVIVNVLGLLLAVNLHSAVRSRNLLRVLFFAPVVMSPLAVSYIWQYILAFNGPLNEVLQDIGLGSAQRPWLSSPTWALWAVLVVMVWQFTGLTMVFYLAGLQAIPVELNEAAAVDGASGFYRFRKVTLPLLGPATTVSVVYTTILGLRVFDQVVALTNGGPGNSSQTMATLIYQDIWVNDQFGYGTAIAVVFSVLVAVAALAQIAILRRREVTD